MFKLISSPWQRETGHSQSFSVMPEMIRFWRGVSLMTSSHLSICRPKYAWTSYMQWRRNEIEAPAAKSFGAFWILQVSSPAVLLLDLGVIHSSFCDSASKFSGWLVGSSCKISNYCGGEKILSAPRFQHCGGERPRWLPPRFRRLWLRVSFLPTSALLLRRETDRQRNRKFLDIIDVFLKTRQDFRFGSLAIKICRKSIGLNRCVAGSDFRRHVAHPGGQYRR